MAWVLWQAPVLPSLKSKQMVDTVTHAFFVPALIANNNKENQSQSRGTWIMSHGMDTLLPWQPSSYYANGVRVSPDRQRREYVMA